MRSFTLYALAALCVGAVFAAPASAVKESTDGTVTIVGLSSQGDPPISGSTRVAGEIKGDLGSGAIVGTNTFGPPGEFQGKFRAFFKKGTIKVTLSGTGTLAPDGTANFSGSGEFTGGSGRYKGAEGSFTFTGSQPPDTTSDSEPAVFEVDGMVKY
jgi:hypothetical protein